MTSLLYFEIVKQDGDNVYLPGGASVHSAADDCGQHYKWTTFR